MQMLVSLAFSLRVVFVLKHLVTPCGKQYTQPADNIASQVVIPTLELILESCLPLSTFNANVSFTCFQPSESTKKKPPANNMKKEKQSCTCRANSHLLFDRCILNLDFLKNLTFWSGLTIVSLLRANQANHG